MKYTSHPENWINDKIHSDVHIICGEILKVIEPKSITSIILAGSFGRGEGSVLVKNGNVFPLKDYDIMLITDRCVMPEEIKKISDRSYDILGYDNPKSPTCGGVSEFVISILPMKPDSLKYLRDIKAFDIKMGSKVLYGKDIRHDIGLTSEDIPISSGARLLFQKVIGLIALFPYKHMEKLPSGDEKLYLNYECGKTYIEIGTALTIISGMYTPTYSKRCNIIDNNFTSNFSELYEKTPLLSKKIHTFTHMKLLPNYDMYNDIDPVKLWFDTRDDLGLVLKYYMYKYLSVRGENWIEFSHDCYDKMEKGNLCDMINYYLKNKFRIDNRYIVDIVNFLYQRHFSVNYMIRLYKKEKMFTMRTVREFPIHRVFTSSILLLFSLRKDGTLDEPLFNMFVDDLRKIYPVKIEGLRDKERWDSAINCLLRAHRINGEVAYRI